MDAYSLADDFVEPSLSTSVSSSDALVAGNTAFGLWLAPGQRVWIALSTFAPGVFIQAGFTVGNQPHTWQPPVVGPGQSFQWLNNQGQNAQFFANSWFGNPSQPLAPTLVQLSANLWTATFSFPNRPPGAAITVLRIL